MIFQVTPHAENQTSLRAYIWNAFYKLPQNLLMSLYKWFTVAIFIWHWYHIFSSTFLKKKPMFWINSEAQNSQFNQEILSISDQWDHIKFPWIGNCINTLRPRQNGRHFADDILNAFSWMKMFEYRLKFHWSLFLRVQSTISQHWFR